MTTGLSAVHHRLTTVSSAVYQRDEKRSLFLAADQCTDAYLSLKTLFMQCMSGNQRVASEICLPAIVWGTRKLIYSWKSLPVGVFCCQSPLFCALPSCAARTTCKDCNPLFVRVPGDLDRQLHSGHSDKTALTFSFIQSLNCEPTNPKLVKEIPIV